MVLHYSERSEHLRCLAVKLRVFILQGHSQSESCTDAKAPQATDCIIKMDMASDIMMNVQGGALMSLIM